MAETGGRLAVPIGVDDFKEIRENGYYYVDKSELISDIIEDKAKVYLFTRPRRFGKSLNLSMLDAFFNLKYKGNTWFDGLKVCGHSKADTHRNEYPVIRLSMTDLDTSKSDQFVSDLCLKIRNLYDNYSYLADTDKLTPLNREKYHKDRKSVV